MSVVVYKAGDLASDGRAYGGRGQTSPGAKWKIHRLEDGTRIGVVSAIIGQPERFVEWYAAGADRKEWGEGQPDLRALIIKPSGEVYLSDDSLAFSGPIECDEYAIGSGADFALGALAMGADAEAAVRAAILYDPNCGEPVRLLKAEG